MRGVRGVLVRPLAALALSLSVHGLVLGGVAAVVSSLRGVSGPRPDAVFVDVTAGQRGAVVRPAATGAIPVRRPVASSPSVAAEPAAIASVAAGEILGEGEPSPGAADPGAADATLTAVASLAPLPSPGSVASAGAVASPGPAVEPGPGPSEASDARDEAGSGSRSAAGEPADPSEGPGEAVAERSPSEPARPSGETDAAAEAFADADALRVATNVRPVFRPEQFEQLQAVTSNPSVSARVESEPVVGRRDIFEFLLDHPEFATHVTRALRLARYRIWQAEDGLFLDDGWGATGRLSLVYASSGTRVMYARGAFQQRLLPSITGQAVVTIDYDFRPGADGREVLSAAVTSQLKVDGTFAELVFKLAGPAVVEKAQLESRRLTRLFAKVLRAVEERPAELYAALDRRPDVPRRELETFRTLLRLP